MPFDGTDLKLAENHPLATLGELERLLASEERWCKGKLRDSNGRHCLAGAMQAVNARQMLEPIVLRAAREVGQKHYWRVELFNDDPRTTHAEVLRVLRCARENIITGIIDADQCAPWTQRFAKSLRSFCSGNFAAGSTALRLQSVAQPAAQLAAVQSPASPSMGSEICAAL